MGGELSTKVGPNSKQKQPVNTDRVSGSTSDDNSVWHLFKESIGKEFFEKPPSLRLLRESQQSFRQQGYIIPTEDGVRVPYPTPTDRQTFLHDVDFTAIDAHVLQIDPDLCLKDIQEIVPLLLKPAKNDLEKVRAIFSWLTTQSLDSLEVKGQKGKDTAAFYLAKVKDGGFGYPQLFEEMCSCAQIPCRSIQGWVKGVGYEPGDTFRDPTGTWSAVYVNGSWRLVDCHWSAWKVVGSKAKDWDVVGNDTKTMENQDLAKLELIKERQYQESFFLTDPEIMIHSHRPAEDHWQLLARPVTMEEFRLLAILKPGFFDMGFEVVEPTSVVQAEGGKASVSVKIPSKGTHTFFYRLSLYAKPTNVTTFGKLNLERFVFLNVNRADHLVTAVFDLPATGKYKFEIFCEDVEHKPNVFELIATYVIFCDRLGRVKPEPYPPNPRVEWGPGIDTKKMGISAVTHPSGLVITTLGRAEIHLRVEQNMEFRHKLIRSDEDSKKYNEYAFCEVRSDLVIYRLRLPEKGKFALKLYVRPKGALPAEFLNICNYLIDNDTVSGRRVSFPEVVIRESAGPTSDFHKLRLKSLSKDSAYTETDSGELDLKFKSSQAIQLTSKSVLLKGNKSRVDHSEYTKFISKADVNSFHLEFPESGLYHFTLAGNVDNDNVGPRPVYHGLVQANLPKIGSLPFPKTLEGWNPCFEVLKPAYGYLPTNQVVPFLVNIPGAVSVSLTTPSPTELTRNKRGHWLGNLPTGSKETEIDLTAIFEKETGKSRLLTFKIVSPSTIDKIIQRQKKDYDREFSRLYPGREKKEEDVGEVESDNSEVLRHRLLTATKSENIPALQAAIGDFQNAGLRQTHGELSQAEIMLDVLHIREELCLAGEDVDAVTRIIEKIEAKKLEYRLEPELKAARELASARNRVARARRAVVNMEAKTMTELRSYNNPPQTVFDVMQASLILLGENQATVQDWKECRRLCNPVGSRGLKRRVEVKGADQLPPDVIQRARNLLTKVRTENVRQICPGAATFHAWASGMIAEADRLKDEKVEQ